MLMKSFSKDEIDEFRKFVASPYFNKGRNHTPLLLFLLNFYPDFDSPELTKENVYSSIYPGKKFKESVVKSMFSRLEELASEFLIQITLKENPGFVRERFLLRQTSLRGLKKSSESIAEKTEKLFREKKRGVLDFMNYRDFHDEVLNSLENFDDRKKLVSRLFRQHNNILYGFLAEFLITEGALYAQKNFWDKAQAENPIFSAVTDDVIDGIIELINENDKPAYEILHILRLLKYATRDIENDEKYFELKDLFFKKAADLDDDFKRFMMNCLTVICTMKSVGGSREFLMEAHKLRRKIHDENLFVFSKRKRLRISEFRTTFIEALGLGEIEWAEAYFHKYAEKIQPSFKKDINSYCRARLAYSKRNYDEALYHAMRVSINQITFKLDIKSLIAQIYYMTGTFEPLFSHLDTYSKLISNSEIQNSALEDSHMNFVRTLRKLLKMRVNKPDVAELQMLKEKVRSQRSTSKTWLLQRIEEMISAGSSKS